MLRFIARRLAIALGLLLVLSVVIYALVALVWIIPDRRFERVLAEAEGGE